MDEQFSAEDRAIADRLRHLVSVSVQPRDPAQVAARALVRESVPWRARFRRWTMAPRIAVVAVVLVVATSVGLGGYIVTKHAGAVWRGRPERVRI